MQLLWNLAPSIFIFCKVLYFLAKIQSNLLYCLYFRVTLLASHIYSTIMGYKGRGPLIYSHSHRHLTPHLHLQPCIYMSEDIFLFHAPYVYRYNKEKIVRRKCTRLRSYLILKISKNPWCDISI